MILVPANMYRFGFSPCNFYFKKQNIQGLF